MGNNYLWGKDTHFACLKFSILDGSGSLGHVLNSSTQQVVIRNRLLLDLKIPHTATKCWTAHISLCVLQGDLSKKEKAKQDNIDIFGF